MIVPRRPPAPTRFILAREKKSLVGINRVDLFQSVVVDVGRRRGWGLVFEHEPPGGKELGCNPTGR